MALASSDTTDNLDLPQKIVRKRSSTYRIDEPGPKRAEIVVDTLSIMRVLTPSTDKEEKATADEDEDDSDGTIAMIAKLRLQVANNRQKKKGDRIRERLGWDHGTLATQARLRTTPKARENGIWGREKRETDRREGVQTRKRLQKYVDWVVCRISKTII
jgi:hypothetical protein